MAKPSEKRSPNDKPTASEFGKLISGLAKLGITGTVLSSIAQTKTRRENAKAIADWLRDRPKAKN